MSGPSRFSSLNSFFRSKTPNPPPPPPKDRDRDNQSLYAQSSFSQSTRSFATIPRTTSPAPTTQTANSSVYHLGQGGASSSVLNLNQFGQQQQGGVRLVGQSSAPSSFKRGVSRIASGLKRPKSRANLLQDPPTPTPKNDEDGGISTPWNFQVRPSSSHVLQLFLIVFIYGSTISTSTRASMACRPRGHRRCSKRDTLTQRSRRCTTPAVHGPRRPLRPYARLRPRPPRTPSSHVLAHPLCLANVRTPQSLVTISLYRLCQV